MSSAEQLSPFLNPDYWQGHCIGDYDAVAADRTNISVMQMQRAGKILEERLSYQQSAFPLETFRDGQVFEPADYEAGTVVLYRHEVLIVRPGSKEARPGNDAALPLRTRPLDLTPYPSSYNEDDMYIRSGETSYRSVARWGIVAAGKRGVSEVLSVPVSCVDKMPDGKVIVNSVSLPGAFNARIGDVRHTMGVSGKEIIERTNILQIIAYGQVSKRKSFFRLGKLAIE